MKEGDELGNVYYSSTDSGNSAGKKEALADTQTLAFAMNPSLEKVHYDPKTRKNFGKSPSLMYEKLGTTQENLFDTTTTINHKLEYNNMDDEYSIDEIVEHLHRTVGIIDDASSETFFRKYTNKSYNRFKLPVTNDKLMRGYGHVFFVKPDCNVLNSDGTGLSKAVENNLTFRHIYQNEPEVFESLSHNVGESYFSFPLSNAATNFPLSDEFIETDTYGNTWTGYKISYGRHNIDSKTAGEVSIHFRDDRNLHIYQIHKLWVEYISGCYRGELYPRTSSIINKILDYAGAIYYFLTAEDGETILFWTKYYGTFPITIPSDPFTWAEGNTVQNPELEITYRYSFKEDYNPIAILEFNKNANMQSMSATYAPVYDAGLGHAGDTWVGVPFIEEIKDSNSSKRIYKLRFHRSDESPTSSLSAFNTARAQAEATFDEKAVFTSTKTTKTTKKKTTKKTAKDTKKPVVAVAPAIAPVYVNASKKKSNTSSSTKKKNTKKKKK